MHKTKFIPRGGAAAAGKIILLPRGRASISPPRTAVSAVTDAVAELWSVPARFKPLLGNRVGDGDRVDEPCVEGHSTKHYCGE